MLEVVGPTVDDVAVGRLDRDQHRSDLPEAAEESRQGQVVQRLAPTARRRADRKPHAVVEERVVLSLPRAASRGGQVVQRVLERAQKRSDVTRVAVLQPQHEGGLSAASGDRQESVRVFVSELGQKMLLSLTRAATLRSRNCLMCAGVPTGTPTAFMPG